MRVLALPRLSLLGTLILASPAAVQCQPCHRACTGRGLLVGLQCYMTPPAMLKWLYNLAHFPIASNPIVVHDLAAYGWQQDADVREDP
jgi:hypothetical protein